MAPRQGGGVTAGDCEGCPGGEFCMFVLGPQVDLPPGLQFSPPLAPGMGRLDPVLFSTTCS